MSSSNYRLEVKISIETKKKLERLKKEFEEEKDKNVSMSFFVSTILDLYLDSLPAKEVEERKLL